MIDGDAETLQGVVPSLDGESSSNYGFQNFWFN